MKQFLSVRSVLVKRNLKYVSIVSILMLKMSMCLIVWASFIMISYKHNQCKRARLMTFTGHVELPNFWQWIYCKFVGVLLKYQKTYKSLQKVRLSVRPTRVSYNLGSFSSWNSHITHRDKAWFPLDRNGIVKSRDSNWF